MRVLILVFALIVLGSTGNQMATAQPGPNPILNNWIAGSPAGSGTGNWNVASNWSSGQVPSATIEDGAVINGGGTAQVNSVVSAQPGSVVLGQGTADGESGILEILSGGNLVVVDDMSTPVDFPADGSVRVGQNAGQGVLAGTETPNPNAGTGTLLVRPGGTLNSVSLTLAGTANSSISLGGPGAGVATVNTGPVSLGRTLRVIGSNVDFNSTSINFLGTSIFTPEPVGSNVSPLKSTGTVVLAGTLQPDFNGVVPAQGQSWNIIDAAHVALGFSSTMPDPDTDFGLGQVIATRTVTGGMNGQLLQMYIKQLPVLNVNRDTSAVSISNPGTAGIPLDGYTIQSGNGILSVANWDSLEDNPGVAGTGWFEGGIPSANRLSEVRSGGTSTLAASGTWALGDIFQPMPEEFGTDLADIEFQYNDPETLATVNGVVNYIGTTGINNLVLFADPATGNVQIRNTSPFTVEIDGYTITSAAGSLNSDPALWTSLQDQPGVAPNWFEGFLTDNRVTEVMSSGTTTLTGNSTTTFDLGGLFKTAGAQDLVFQFLLADNNLPNTGIVRYEAAPSVDALPGDYNNDGKVDAADYVVWRKTDGSPGGYSTWRMNFGRTAGSGAASGSSLASGAVPEPATLVLLAGGLVALTLARRPMLGRHPANNEA